MMAPVRSPDRLRLTPFERTCSVGPSAVPGHQASRKSDRKQRWKDSLATGQAFERVFPLKGADGAFRPFLTRIVPLDRFGNHPHRAGLVVLRV